MPINDERDEPVNVSPIAIDRAWIGASPSVFTNPTIWVAALVVGLFGVGTFATLHQSWPPAITVTLHAVGIFLAFTVLHDTVHGVAHRNRRFERALGRISALVLLDSFYLFRAVHTEHHSHTNDPARDPDSALSRRPRWLLPVWCLTLTLEQRIAYFRRRLWRNRAELIETIATDVVLVGAIAAAAISGHLEMMAILWLIPSVVALMWIALTFGYFPHYPYDSTTRFYDARIFPSRVLDFPFVGQNYHLIHHLWPTIPWYRQGRVFRRLRKELEQRDVRIGWRVTRLPAFAAIDRSGSP